MKSLISIIIPCYNAEKYIDRCLNSLVNQTIGIEKLQLILVNDASTDTTLEVLKEWGSKYPDNILIITYDENIRQGGARNRGLEYAEGEYIGFVDADDWVEPCMYEEMYKKAIETGFQTVRCKYIDDDGKVLPIINDKQRADQSYEFEKKNGIYIQNIEDTGNNGNYGGIFALYKSSFIKETGMLFPEKLAYEDNFWSAILSLYQKNLYIIDQVYYHYYNNPESTVMKRNNLRLLDKLTIEVLILEEYKKRGIYELIKDKAMQDFFQRGYINLMYMVYMRFDYLPIDLNDIRRVIELCIPDFRQFLQRFKGGDFPGNELLLEVLERQDEIGWEEQQEIKNKYLSYYVDYVKNRDR